MFRSAVTVAGLPSPRQWPCPVRRRQRPSRPANPVTSALTYDDGPNAGTTTQC